MRASFLFISAAALVSPFATSAVWADDQQNSPPQDAAPTTSAAGNAEKSGLGEIVVYAQRRAGGEAVQKVPVAVTAIDQHTLQVANVRTLVDVGALAPSVQTNTTGTFPGFPNFTIRGIGTTGSVRTVDPGVNIIQDGMVLAYQAGAAASTFDLDSIEVLRGPQGVLFGRNATGGAIVMRTRLPSDRFGIRADFSYGNFNDINANASIEGPLGTPDVLGKIAILYRSNTGTIRNTNDGIFVPAVGNPSGAASSHPTGHIGDIDELTIKPTFLFHISDGTKLTLFTQYQRNDDDGTVPRPFASPPGLTKTQDETLFGFTPTNSGYSTNMTYVGYIRLRGGHVIAQLENHIGSGLLTTVAGYRHLTYNSNTNQSATPFDGLLFPDNREHNTEYSLESRYNVGLVKGVDLTAGAYYMRSDVHVLERRRTTGPASNPLNYGYIQGAAFQRTNALAGFVNLDWQVIDGVKLSAGGRYSTERKTIDYSPLAACTDATFTTCKVTPLSEAKRWNNFSPRFTASWEIAPRVMAYASYTRGFRSGNYNARTADPTGVGVGPANPETVGTIEAGIKSEFFDRKVRLNVDVFQSRYHDIQQTVNVPGANPVAALVNAAGARIRGVEGEFAAKPVRNLEIDANVGYLDAHYTAFNIPIVGAGVANPLDLKLPKIPKWTAYVAGNYTIDLAPGWALDTRVSYDWRSSYTTDFLNTPGLSQKAYGLTGGNVSLQHDNWSVSLYATNIFNVDYADTKARLFAYVEEGGAPRTFGVRLTWRM